MPILAPFEAFARDAVALRVEEDESRLPVRWLAGAQVGARLADARPTDRYALVQKWAGQTNGESDLWSMIAVDGIRVTDFASALRTILAIGAEAQQGGALNLAYSMTTHVRIACLDRGPVVVRAKATLQQAIILEQMGLNIEARYTYEEACEDGIRGFDAEVEQRAAEGARRLEIYKE